MIDIIPQSANAPTAEVGQAFAKGLQAHGVQCRFTAEPTSEYVAGWGWRRLMPYYKQGRQCIVLERGYIGNRSKWFSIGWNGLNGRADFLNKDVPDDRWLDKFEPMLHAWREGGDYILLCGQVPGDMSLQGKDINSTYPKIAETLQRFYKMPVVYRPHPEAVKKGKGYAELRGFETSRHERIEDAIDQAALVWSYNSNSGVDAVMRGCPTAALDHGSMAWEVATRGIGAASRPCRNDWGRKMAYTQWTVEEIAAGVAWEHIGKPYRNFARMVGK